VELINGVVKEAPELIADPPVACVNQVILLEDDAFKVTVPGPQRVTSDAAGAEGSWDTVAITGTRLLLQLAVPDSA
jgi:hypothetical protein